MYLEKIKKILEKNKINYDVYLDEHRNDFVIYIHINNKKAEIEFNIIKNYHFYVKYYLSYGILQEVLIRINFKKLISSLKKT